MEEMVILACYRTDREKYIRSIAKLTLRIKMCRKLPFRLVYFGQDMYTGCQTGIEQLIHKILERDGYAIPLFLASWSIVPQVLMGQFRKENLDGWIYVP
jgi:hypothetical protein